MGRFKRNSGSTDGGRPLSTHELCVITLAGEWGYDAAASRQAWTTEEDVRALWAAVREREIAEHIERGGPGSRPLAFWVLDWPELQAQRRLQEGRQHGDIELLRAAGLLTPAELEILKSQEKKP